MGGEDLERYEADLELALLEEYKAVLPMFRFAIETERRFYLANEVDVRPHGGVAGFFEVSLGDVWVWDVYRTARFVPRVRVVTSRDVNVEELPEWEL